MSSTGIVANGRLRLFLTSDCNLACFYCHNEGQPKGSSYLSQTLVDRTQDLLAATHVRQLIFSGGEPLIHPDVLSYVRRLSPYVQQASLITNGLLLDQAMAEGLRSAGLSKIRLGVDSFRTLKPRPSKGYLEKPFSIARTVQVAREAGLQLELNNVLTRFNRAEVATFLRFAVDNGLNIKFFEHLQVLPGAEGSLVNRMTPKPQVEEERFMGVLEKTLGHLPEFAATDEFAPATTAANVGATEIRYCRYLCSYGRCAAPGTRLDPEGFVYTCMSNRGDDHILPTTPIEDMQRIFARASARRCSAGLFVGAEN